eukprot:scaffold48493_cov54-Attheya_sp.AAC.2
MSSCIMRNASNIKWTWWLMIAVALMGTSNSLEVTAHLSSETLEGGQYRDESVSACTRKRIRLDRFPHAWKACRLAKPESTIDPGCCSCYDNANTTDLWNITAMPTTALGVLLDHGQIPSANFSMEDLYYSENMAMIPDISIVGRDYYTLVYDLNLEVVFPPGKNECDSILELEGVNYMATVYLDGAIPLVPRVPNGMFHRHHYTIPGGTKFVSIRVEPPLHVGNPVCPVSSEEPCGQGGNHELAMDGPTAQFMLGWDWCQAMPDRSTGFFGAITLETFPSFKNPALVSIRDPAIHLIPVNDTTERNKNSSDQLKLRIMAHLTVFTHVEHVRPGVLTITADWGETFNLDFEIPPGVLDMDISMIVAIDATNIKLWWPHGTVGSGDEAHLHSFIFDAWMNTTGGKPFLSHQVERKIGLRSVDTYIDETTGGQVFRINGYKMFLTGGNWITTDQALRFSASKERYCQELKLHRYAGLQLIRVWGGGVIERQAFYECADEMGLLVYQEFPMTGDNNGRWAGNYSWPLDYGTYLANCKDTIRRLRQHASLLFYGGGNELWAPDSASSPPRQINEGIQSLLQELDPGRFYIPSSMDGGILGGNMSQHDPTFALAVKDGPYHMILPYSAFDRNPGLPANLTIGFQPEIGSVGAPSYRGLLRFMTPHEAERGYPSTDEDSHSKSVWNFHKHQEWTIQVYNETIRTNVTHDFVGTYFGPNGAPTVSDWCAAAQLAAHQQYQNLMGSFISHMFDWYTTILIWKTATPWPSLRGFLYDYYLESTGSLFGVRAALVSPVSIILDAKTWQLRIANRGISAISNLETKASLGASYEWIDMTGSRVASGQLYLVPDTNSEESRLDSMSAVLLGEKNDSLEWPDACDDVCFLRLETLDEQLLPVFDSESTNVVLLPGETNFRSIETPIPASIAPLLLSLGHDDDDIINLTVEVSSWNGSPIRVQLDLRMDCIHADVKASRLTN